MVSEGVMPEAGPARVAGTRREYLPVGSTAAIPAANGPGHSCRFDLDWIPMGGGGSGQILPQPLLSAGILSVL